VRGQISVEQLSSSNVGDVTVPLALGAFLIWMANYRLHMHPDDMTPEERLERVIELLALASVRLAEDEAGVAIPPDALPQKGLDSSGKSV